MSLVIQAIILYGLLIGVVLVIDFWIQLKNIPYNSENTTIHDVYSKKQRRIEHKHMDYDSDIHQRIEEKNFKKF